MDCKTERIFACDTVIIHQCLEELKLHRNVQLKALKSVNPVFSQCIDYQLFK